MQLACRNLSASYVAPSKGTSRDWALRNISFSLTSGEFLGIAGPTGSGKSTLLQHLCGLLSPAEGTLLIDGQELSGKAAQRSLRGKVGMAFQYPERQLFAGSVLEDVAFGPKNMGHAADQAAELARKALASVGLGDEELEQRNPFALSGGQQRRVALAGILAMQPEILLLDEPAAGLDPKAHKEMLELVSGLRQQGMTIVMASHDMDDLAAYCDRILVLDGGRQAALGAAAEVFSQVDLLTSIGLDLPFAQRYALDLKTAGIPLPRTFYPTLEALASDIALVL